MLNNPSFPQASLEGASYKPSKAGGAPIVNSVDANVNTLHEDSAPEVQGADWVGMARNAYNSSEDWLQINQRAIWARNLAHYRSEHAPDSVLHNEANKHRAKHFWPKTRTLVRGIQAAVASAFFSSTDVVEIEAIDQDNQKQVGAAQFMKGLVDYRLTRTVPWYRIVLGAASEAAVLGTVVSHQSWLYKEEDILVKQLHDEETGETIGFYETKVIHDKPNIRIVPAENIRVSPAADWLDPANSSPYLIELMPMYVCDVKARIAEGSESKAGEPAWRNVGTANLIGSGSRDNLDTTRKARAGAGRLDPKSNQMEISDEFRIVWIHRNIIRHNDVDWLYYTVGTNTLLSDPVRLDSVIPWANGKRDYVFGVLEVETDRPYPSGPVELTAGLQRAYNELGNQRFDNVRQVLNKRYLYRAGNQVDVRALSRNAPGGLIGITAPGELRSHVQGLETPDVTASSYKEADMLGLAMDDLSGATSGTSASASRKLQETAAGMNMMADAANAIREMELKTFTKTWYEPVMEQIVQLEAMYETDSTAMIVSAEKAELLQILPEYFDHKFSVSVNVGMGSTNPTQRLQRLQGAVATSVQLVPEASMAMNGEAVVKEVFAVAGYDNGSRFFNFEMGKQKQAEMQQQGDPQLQFQREQLQARSEIEQAKLQLQQAKLEIDQQKTQMLLRELESKIANLDAKTVTEKATTLVEAATVASTVSANPASAPVLDSVLDEVGFSKQEQPT